MIMHDSLKKIYIISVLISLTLLVGCASKDIDVYSGLTAKQIYDQGKTNAQKGKFQDAAKDFEALEINYPYGKYADKAKLSLIHAYYGKKEYIQAKAVADRFIRMYPNHPNVDYAHYMQGAANYEQYYSMMYKLLNLDRNLREPNLAEEAFQNFKILLEKFPNSKYALDASQRMIHLKNELAKYHLSVAQYYLAKKAYIAAANRAKLIVTNFDRSPVIEDALKIMIESYRSLDLPELEQASVDLLNVNFESIN